MKIGSINEDLGIEKRISITPEIAKEYSDKFHFQAAKITKMFNNRLDKFSKYQIGLLETFYR